MRAFARPEQALRPAGFGALQIRPLTRGLELGLCLRGRAADERRDQRGEDDERPQSPLIQSSSGPVSDWSTEPTEAPSVMWSWSLR